MDGCDDLDDKARDLTAKAREAFAEMKVELEELAEDARKDLAELQTRAEAELRDVRSKVAAFIDPDRPTPAHAAEDTTPPGDPPPEGEAEMGHA